MRQATAASNWGNIRPQLFEYWVGMAAVPAAHECCCFCSQPAVVGCRDCGPGHMMPMCAECDRKRHPYAHWHERATWGAGYWQPLPASSEFSNSGQLVEDAVKVYMAMGPCTKCGSRNGWDFTCPVSIAGQITVVYRGEVPSSTA